MTTKILYAVVLLCITNNTGAMESREPRKSALKNPLAKKNTEKRVTFATKGTIRIYKVESSDGNPISMLSTSKWRARCNAKKSKMRNKKNAPRNTNRSIIR